jgi:hypothetical protein
VTLRLGLDTGTSRTLVSAVAAIRLGLSPREPLSISSAAGPPRPGLCGTGPALHLAGLALVPDCLGWLPDERVVAGAEDLDGILGADLLAQFDLWIDIRSAPVRARFAPPGSLEPWTAGERLPLVSIGRRPAIAARLAGLRRDGSAVRLVIDSGADSLILFGAAALQTLAASRHERLEGQLASATARRDVATVPMSGFRSAGSLFQVPWAGLLPQVQDRAEDGLLPLNALGPVLLDLSNGVIVANARLRSAPWKGDRRPYAESRAPGR